MTAQHGDQTTGDIHRADDQEYATVTAMLNDGDWNSNEDNIGKLVWVQSDNELYRLRDTTPTFDDIGGSSGSSVTDLDSTRIMSGSEVTVNGDDAETWDLAAGSACVVDSTSPNNPTQTNLEWTAQTGLAVTALASADKTAIGLTHDNTARSGIDFSVSFTGTVDGVSGTIYVAQKTEDDAVFDSKERRLYAALGRLTHFSNTAIDADVNLQLTGYALGQSLLDVIEVIGLQNKSGNEYSATGSGAATFDKSAGVVFSPGANFTTDPNDQNSPATAQETAVSFFTRYWDGSDWVQSSGTTSFPFTQYNDYDAGTLVTVTANRWSAHRVYLFADTNRTIIQYGQASYTSLDAAIEDLQSISFIADSDLTANAIFRGWFISRGGETATDGGDWYWQPPANASAGTGAGTVVVTLQSAFEASDDPEIQVNSTTGALTITEDGTLSNGDAIFEVLGDADEILFEVDNRGNRDMQSTGAISSWDLFSNAELDIEAYDTSSSATYNDRMKFDLTPDQLDIQYIAGNGAGGSTSLHGFQILDDAINTFLGTVSHTIYDGTTTGSTSLMTFSGSNTGTLLSPYMTLHETMATANDAFINFGKEAGLLWNDGTRDVTVFSVLGVVNVGDTFTHMESDFKSIRHDYIDLDQFDWTFDTGASGVGQWTVYGDESKTIELFGINRADAAPFIGEDADGLRFYGLTTSADYWYLEKNGENFRIRHHDNSEMTDTTLVNFQSTGTIAINNGNIEFGSDLGTQYDHAGGSGNGYWLLQHNDTNDDLELIHNNGTTDTTVLMFDDTTLNANFLVDVTAESFDLHPYQVELADPATDGVAITSTEAQLAFDTIEIPNASIYTLGSDQITVLKSGVFEISYKVGVVEDSASGGTRTGVSVYMKVNGTTVGHSESTQYFRESSGGTTVTATFMQSITANDVLTFFVIGDPETTDPDISQDITDISIKQVGP